MPLAAQPSPSAAAIAWKVSAAHSQAGQTVCPACLVFAHSAAEVAPVALRVRVPNWKAAVHSAAASHRRLPLARIGRALRGLALLCSLLGVLRVRIDRAHVLFRVAVARGVLLPGRILDPLDVQTCLRDRAGNQHTDGGGAEKKIRPHLWPPLACPPAFLNLLGQLDVRTRVPGTRTKQRVPSCEGTRNQQARIEIEFEGARSADQLPLRSWMTGKL